MAKNTFPSMNFTLFPKSNSTWKREFQKLINAIFGKKTKNPGLKGVIQYHFKTTGGAELIFEKVSSAIHDLNVDKEYVLFPEENPENSYPAEVSHKLTFDEKSKKIVKVVHGKKRITKGNAVYFLKQKMAKAGWTFLEEKSCN